MLKFSQNKGIDFTIFINLILITLSQFTFQLMNAILHHTSPHNTYPCLKTFYIQFLTFNIMLFEIAIAKHIVNVLK